MVEFLIPLKVEARPGGNLKCFWMFFMAMDFLMPKILAIAIAAPKEI